MPNTNAQRYREAYLNSNPQTVGEYFDMLMAIDPDGSMVNRNGQVWIEFSDGSEWRLGAAEKPANQANHWDA